MAFQIEMLPEWVDNIVGVDTFFSPCERCCFEGSKGSTRDRQANFFVVNSRRRNLTACSHCKPDLESEGAVTLQIRRSSHHDVVKIQDLQKLCPEAVQGIQSYTINGQKVAFLRRRAVPKEARVGPMCVTCYRSLQDNNIFCSLECKRIRTMGLPSPTPSSGSSGGSPLSPATGEWGSFKTFYSHPSNCSSDDLFYSPAKKRRKSIPRRSPLE